MLRPPYDRRGGFTLIEILFALALISLLAGILFMAGKSVLSGSQEKSTKVTLAALKGMLAEYDSKTRLSRAPKYWLWYDPTTTKAAVRTDAKEFWEGPMLSRPPIGLTRDALDAPGLIAAGAYSADDPAQTSVEELNRNGSRHVLNTQLVMSLILAMPANRAALSQLSPERYFTPRWVSGNRLPAPGSDGWFNPAGGESTDDVIYPQGTKFLSSIGSETKSFIVLAPNFPFYLQSPAAAPATPTPDMGEDRSPPTPILLDAWGNPIIFVPGSGLRLRLLNGASEYTDTTLNLVKTTIITSPEGKVDTTTDPNVPRVLQTGRPFFASAGPDGDFSKGDDNIYSFEQ